MWGEALEYAQLSGEGAAVVHVQLVFSGPMEGLAGPELEAGEGNSMAAIELDIALGKVLPNDADELDRAEKTRGDGGVAGGNPQQGGGFGMGGFCWGPG